MIEAQSDSRSPGEKRVTRHKDVPCWPVRRCHEARCLVMDKAYEGDETRQLVVDLGLKPVVPPKANRVCPWDYDRELYKRRNEVERLFRRLKRFRRVFTRFA